MASLIYDGKAHDLNTSQLDFLHSGGLTFIGDKWYSGKYVARSNRGDGRSG